MQPKMSDVRPWISHLYIIFNGASDPDSLIASLEREPSNVDHWLTLKEEINVEETFVISGNSGKFAKV